MTNNQSCLGESIENGYLIDLTDIAKSIGIPFTVAISTTLYNDEAIDRPRLYSHLVDIIEMSLRTKAERWTEMRGPEEEEFGFGSFLDRDDCTWPIDIRVVVEKQPDGSLAAILLNSKERYSSKRGPAASFHEN